LSNKSCNFSPYGCEIAVFSGSCSETEVSKQLEYINKDECIKLLELSVNLVDEFVLIDRDYAEALNEAIRLDYSAYDMLYLILARNNGAVLLTCDGPLNRIAEKEGIHIA
jgi:predicted nucleic acid-binding protein